MNKRDNLPCDWILYHPDEVIDGNYVKCIAVGARTAIYIHGTVIKGGGFYGTYHEALVEVERRNSIFIEEERRNNGRNQNKRQHRPVSA